LLGAVVGWNVAMLNPAETTQAFDAAETPQNSVFTIKDIRPICRARTLRLQTDDAIVAVDGQPFKGDVDLLLDMIFECDPQTGIFLTVFREESLFHVIARGPLGCAFEYAKPEIAEAASKKLAKTTIAPLAEYRIFEVLRDINRKCVIIDTQPSMMAMLASPVWLVHCRLWEVLLAVLLIYGVTLLVSWMLFVIVFILLALYFRQAQLTLQRSFNLMRQRQMWMIVAARSVQEVQETCRQFDPKSTFKPSFVGSPQEEEAKPKKRRRRRPEQPPAEASAASAQPEQN
jgi:hypothetical protein